MGLPSEFNKLRKGNQELIFWNNNYLVPPQVIAHIKRSSSKGVLVSPYWPSAAYWPLLATSKNKLITFRY